MAQRLPSRSGHRARATTAAVALAALVGVPAIWLHGSAGAQEDAAEADGAFLFARDCASCHGSQGQGTGFAPSIQEAGAAGIDFVLRTGRMPLERTVGYPELAEGAPVRRGSTLPAGEPAYSPPQIAAIVDHTRSFVSGPEVPEVSIGTAAARDGATLYQNNCAACHAWSGVGGALTNGQSAPTLARSEPVEVVEAMRFGPGTMPVFSRAVLDERDADAIATYVELLRDPPSPGGHPLAQLGPVSEGLVGWAVGIVALLLAVRWIGRRT